MTRLFHTNGSLTRDLLWRFGALLALLSVILLPAPVRSQDDAPIVSFPGNYGQAIGSPSWAPDDPAVTGADDDGDGVHTLTVTLPRGSYEFKVALNGSWDENYGLNGAADGPNIPFDVPAESEVVFAFDTNLRTIALTVAGEPVNLMGAPSGAGVVPAHRAGDGQIDRDGILHDSRSDLFRTPFGAQPFATDVMLRLRTAAGDVDQVLLLVDTLSTETSFSLPMARVARDPTHDWWQVALNTGAEPVVHNYKFQVNDGGATLFYADDSLGPQRLGGSGEVRESRPFAAEGWDLYVYDPAFEVPAWAQDAIIYQIFPDRFRNGDRTNDPRPGDFGYPSERGEIFPIVPWNFVVPDPDPQDPANPWQATWNATFYGGDLQGVLD
ncbi:MAG: alpha amylase N-terminal ig-like domain-containing protein, partial [Caldilineaceae bacterium]